VGDKALKAKPPDTEVADGEAQAGLPGILADRRPGRVEDAADEGPSHWASAMRLVVGRAASLAQRTASQAPGAVASKPSALRSPLAGLALAGLLLLLVEAAALSGPTLRLAT